MEEKKDTKAFEDMWTLIKDLENMINRIYYIGQIEVADEFDKKIHDLKKRFLEKAYSNNTIVKDVNVDDIITESIVLKTEINKYFDKEGNEIEKKINSERLIPNTEDIPQISEKQSTEEMWNSVKKIVEDWRSDCKNHPRLDAQQREINKIISKSVLRILESQAKNGEEVDLELAYELCNRTDLVNAVKKELIQKAKEDEYLDKREEVNDMANYLTEEGLTDPKVWEYLVRKENVKIKEIQPKTVENDAVAEISKPEKSEYKKRNSDQTIYTLGDIDEKTGEWINVKKICGKFPKKFSEKDRNRVLKIEINGVKNIEFDSFQYNEFGVIKPIYSNLQEVIIGNGVQCISHGLFLKYEKLKKVILGTGITEIPYECFFNSGIESVIMTENISGIGREAFQNCKSLTEIQFGENIKIKLPVYLELFQNGQIDREKLERIMADVKESNEE